MRHALRHRKESHKAEQACICRAYFYHLVLSPPRDCPGICKPPARPRRPAPTIPTFIRAASTAQPQTSSKLS